MANYGDVACKLPKNWDRNMFATDELQQGTVGHTNGVADVCLKDSPEQEHQFYWCDMQDMRDMNKAIQRGYKLVHKDTWVKNVDLWDWDASGNLMNGYDKGALRLMARPAERFYDDEKRREQIKERAVAIDDALDATPSTIVPTDDRGDRARGPRRPRN